MGSRLTFTAPRKFTSNSVSASIFDRCRFGFSHHGDARCHVEDDVAESSKCMIGDIDFEHEWFVFHVARPRRINTSYKPWH